MKKLKSIISVLIIISLFLFSGIMTTACGSENEPPNDPTTQTPGGGTGGGSGGTGGSGGNNTGGSDTPRPPAPSRITFENLSNLISVDIDDDDQSVAVEQRQVTTTATHEVGFLAVFDKNNELRHVNFVYEHTTTVQTLEGEDIISEEITVNQDYIEASITNLYVTSRFTYITFSRLGVANNMGWGYGAAFTSNSLFRSDSNHQTFIIDNDTKRVYPAAGLGNFSRIRENFVRKSPSNRFYELSIDNDGNLNSRGIIPNLAISATDILVDRYGTVFVLNSHDNYVDRENNFIFHTNAAPPKFLGDDGLVYRVNRLNSHEVIEVTYFDNQLQRQPLPSGRTVRFDNFLVRHDRLFFGGSSSNNPSVEHSWLHHLIIENGTTRSIFDHGGLHNAYTFDSSSGNTFILVGREIFVSRNIDGRDTLFAYNTSTRTISNISIAEFTNLEIRGNSLILTRERIHGTQMYEVRVTDGEVSLVQLVDITHEHRIITIQPLN